MIMMFIMKDLIFRCRGVPARVAGLELQRVAGLGVPACAGLGVPARCGCGVRDVVD